MSLKLFRSVICGKAFIVAVCAVWTVAETLSCDQCGRECIPICGTRQFRACCFNNMKKRVPNVGLKLWLVPPTEYSRLQLLYDS